MPEQDPLGGMPEAGQGSMHRPSVLILALLLVASCSGAGPTPKTVPVYATPAPGTPASASPAKLPVVGVLGSPTPFTAPSGSQFSVTVSYRGSWACNIYENCGFGHSSNKQEIVWIDIHVTRGTLPYGGDEFTARDRDGNQYQLWRTNGGPFSGTLSAAAGSRAHGVLDFVVPARTTALRLDWWPSWASGPVASWALTPFQ